MDFYVYKGNAQIGSFEAKLSNKDFYLGGNLRDSTYLGVDTAFRNVRIDLNRENIEFEIHDYIKGGNPVEWTMYVGLDDVEIKQKSFSITGENAILTAEVLQPENPDIKYDKTKKSIKIKGGKTFKVKLQLEKK